MLAATIVRLVAMAVLLGLTSGCDLFLGVPDLGDPANVASMKVRFKATIQSQVRDPAPLDWDTQDQQIWFHPMGPRVVAVCGRPINAPATQRAYQINYFRGSFGAIGEVEVETPAHPPERASPSFCGMRPSGSDGAANP